jgi:hypothetical protein
VECSSAGHLNPETAKAADWPPFELSMVSRISKFRNPAIEFCQETVEGGRATMVATELHTARGKKEKLP